VSSGEPNSTVLRPLSRGESQALTRETVLAAAEKLFLSKGFHGTTVAQIAANAGRTQGSIYGHFAAKEDLCFAVLQRQYAHAYGELAEQVGAAQGGLDEKLGVVAEWWRAVTANEPLILLIVEYALAAGRGSEQPFIALTSGSYATLRELVRSIFLMDSTAEGLDDEGLDAATMGIVATGAGLLMNQFISIVDTQTSVDVLIETFRLWLNRMRQQKHSDG
jgi:AcrR family transcriptional regulator